MNKFSVPGKVKKVTRTIITPEIVNLGLILSFNNNQGKTDYPLLKIFDKKWKRVKEDVKGWYHTRTGAYKLGAINTTAVQSDVWVVHLLCQNEKDEVDLTGLEECLKKVMEMAKFEKASVHISSLLLDLAPTLEKLTSKYFIENGINVSFYTEPVTLVEREKKVTHR